VNNPKKLLKTLLKFLLSGLALYIVFKNIKWEQVSGLLVHANAFYLILAAIFFIASKVLSAYRLQRFFACIPLKISSLYNLKLYWIGMFYNLFLPGGVGGDGYKVYLLNKHYGVKVKSLIQASLIDRVSGLTSLLILAGAGFLLPNVSGLPEWLKYADMACLIMVLPVLYLVTRLLFKTFVPALSVSMLWSLGVQLLQVVSAFCILYALGTNGSYIAYGVLFLVSSFVSIIPFTIGGLGSRELTFLIGYQYLGINENVSIALSLSFTLITALVSFGGIFIKTEPVVVEE